MNAGLREARADAALVRPILIEVTHHPVRAYSTTNDCVDSQSVEYWFNAPGGRAQMDELIRRLRLSGFTHVREPGGREWFRYDGPRSRSWHSRVNVDAVEGLISVGFIVQV